MSVDFLINIFAFVVVIGFLIFVHEFGHFTMAKLLGIRVEVFSLGFGPRIFGFRKGETDYRFSLLFFLGGYVKMLGENPDEELRGNKEEFLSRSKFERFLVLFMGPFTNILIAFLLMTVVYMIGTTVPAHREGPPVIGYVKENSAADEADLQVGDRITRLEGKSITRWSEFEEKFMINPGKALSLEVKRNGKTVNLEVIPRESGVYSVGSAGVMPPVEFRIDNVLPGLPAEQAGLKVDDTIEKIDGKKIINYQTGMDILSKHPGEEVKLTVKRGSETIERTLETLTRYELSLYYGGQVYPMLISPGQKEEGTGLGAVINGRTYGVDPALENGDRIVSLNGRKIRNFSDVKSIMNDGTPKILKITVRRGDKEIQSTLFPSSIEKEGYIGVSNLQIIPLIKKFGFLEAVKESIRMNLSWLKMLGETIKNLFTGILSLKALSGPIDIAKFSGQALREGFLINFIAFVSLNLGIINLLPIPVLDGGHIFILLAEGVSRRNFSMAFKERLMQIGFVILITLMVVIISLDLIKNIPFLRDAMI